MDDRERQPAVEQFPEELQYFSVYVSLWLLQLAVNERACPIADSKDSDVYVFMQQHVEPAIHEIGAVWSYVDLPPKKKNKISRIYFITHFERKDNLPLRKILREIGITWPLSTFRSPSGMLMMNLVETVRPRPLRGKVFKFEDERRVAVPTAAGLVPA